MDDYIQYTGFFLEVWHCPCAVYIEILKKEGYIPITKRLELLNTFCELGYTFENRSALTTENATVANFEILILHRQFIINFYVLC